MTTQAPVFKRVKRKIKTSRNPLFEKWLKEWKDEASSKGSDMQYCFGKALKSLQKFPVKLYSGKDCIMLENFGAKLCQKLEEKLEDYKAAHPEDLSVYPQAGKESNSDLTLIAEIKIRTTKKRCSNELSPIKKKKVDTAANNNFENKTRTKTSNYTPAYRSGAYAILVAMFEKSQENDFKGYLTRVEIQSSAQDLCDSSFTKPLPGSYYTAWSSMGTLVKKNLISKEGTKPIRFSLTQEGMDLAVKLKEINNQFEDNLVSPVRAVPTQISKSPAPRANVQKVSPQKKELEREPESVSEVEETVFMLPGTFEIVLLVDTQERDEKHQHSDGMTMRQLQQRNVNFEIRHLKVGDFIWIARDMHNGFELVLPYIVERKRMDDLASSIKDGRFHEQKFRLKQSGIENLIYLIEKYGNENQRLGLPLPSLRQAISNTQILDGFTVRVTDNHDHSMRYLDCITNHLSNLFKSKTLMSCKKSDLPPANLSDDLISLMTFKDFNKGSEKNKRPSVKNMLIKHLLQLNGVSLEKAQVITQMYPTPKSLMEVLKRTTGERSIADLTYGSFNRAIGPVVAKQIHMLYTSLDLK